MSSYRLLLESILAGTTRVEEKLDALDKRVGALEIDKAHATGAVTGGRAVWGAIVTIGGGLLALVMWAVPHLMAGVAPAPRVSPAPLAQPGPAAAP